MEDCEILKLFLARSEDAIRETEKKYAGYCRSVSYGVLGSREDAEECVNDTLLRAWNSIPPNQPDNLRVYLGRIARNLSIDRYRSAVSKKRGEGAAEASFSELENVLPVLGSSEEDLNEEALLRSINEFLLEQKELYRKVFVQKVWYLLPVRRIAELHGISESKTLSILYRMRRKLEAKLRKEGFPL